MVFALEPLGMFPFHFVISDGSSISLICVRHPRYLDSNLCCIEYLMQGSHPETPGPADQPGYPQGDLGKENRTGLVPVSRAAGDH